MPVCHLSHLQELLTKDVAFTVGEDGCVKLEEAEGNKPYYVEIYGVPSNSIVVKMDRFPDTRKFFRGNLGENKRSDFLLISEQPRGQIVCIHIELKAGQDKWGDIVKQLKGSCALWQYMCNLKELFGNGVSWFDCCTHRYVTIKNIAINKQATVGRSRSVAQHSSPESALKISSPHRNKVHYRNIS